MQNTEAPNDPHRPEPFIPITIDHRPYKAPRTPMTGIELKALAGISDAFDLWFETPGPTDDVKVVDGQPFAFKPGAHFYSMPRTINPGS